MTKIFGIGLSRTGTTSLSHALNEVGINMVHYPKTKADLLNLKTAGACDLPVVVYYKELDKKFPNSKFIYTIRNKDEWLVSIEKYLKRKEDHRIDPWQEQNRIKAYGQVKFDKEVYAASYDAHDKDVREYFKGREQNLLILDICGGDELNKLLMFVGVSDTDKTFPHENKRRA